MDGENLREASHERAVEVIRKAGNPVTFLVQSLIDWDPEPSLMTTTSTATAATKEQDTSEHLLPNGDSTPPDGGMTGLELPKVAPELLPPTSCVTPTPEVIQSGVTVAPVRSAVKRQETEPGESDEEEEDEGDMQGRMVLPNGIEVLGMTCQ